MRSLLRSKLLLLLASTVVSTGVMANLETSEISIGSIDRKSGGRTYIIGLSSSNIQSISFTSTSENSNTKVNVLAVDYFNEGDVLSLVNEPTFTRNDEFYAPLTFGLGGLSDVAKYPLGDKTLFCKGACLQVTAEAYGADDIKLKILINSTDEKVYMTSLSGMPAKVEVIVQERDQNQDQDQNQCDQDNYDQDDNDDLGPIDTGVQETEVSGETFFKTYKGVLIRFSKVTENIDGSRNYYNPQAFWGDMQYPVTSVESKFCRAIQKGRDIRVYKGLNYHSKLAFISYDNIYTIKTHKRVVKVTCER